MQVVGFKDFCSHPPGTIFSYWTDGKPEGLYRKGGTVFRDCIPIDYFQASLIGAPYPVEENLGVHDEDEQYLVHESVDLQRLVRALGFPATRDEFIRKDTEILLKIMKKTGAIR